MRAIESGLPLYPEEESSMQRAVLRRRDEFATGRWCARQALAKLNLDPRPIPIGPWRNPVWPDHVTGSISHTADMCAAVVARRTDWKAIGIDMLDRASAAQLSVAAGRLLAHPREGQALPAALPDGITAFALLFSVKEAAIKALSPTLERLVDFPELHVQFGESTFAAELDSTELRVAGWWAATNELILTGAALA